MKIPEDLPATPLFLEHRSGPGAGFDPMLVASEDPDSPAAERYRMLHHRLGALPGGRPRSLVITSAMPGEGKSLTAANLAIVAASSGRRVVLVECDLRRPRLRRLFRFPASTSLTDVLTGRSNFTAALQRSPHGGPSVLACGERYPDPCGALASAAMGQLLRDLTAAYDEVYLDAPPILSFADVHLVAAHAGAALLVARAGVTPRERLQEAVDALGAARVVGVVLNGIEVPHELYQGSSEAV